MRLSFEESRIRSHFPSSLREIRGIWPLLGQIRKFTDLTFRTEVAHPCRKAQQEWDAGLFPAGRVLEGEIGSMHPYEPFLDANGAAPVRGYIHRPAGAATEGLVLTHGAGANCETALLLALAGAFCEAGMMVLRCDLPFRQVRPTGPPPRGSAEHDRRGLRAAIEVMRRLVPDRVLLGGHSYGGRQSSMLAAEEPGVADALLLLSYPLHPPRRPDDLRTAHFPLLRTPSLFVHGVRDPFGSIDELTSALSLVPAQTQLLPVEGAGHELLSKRKDDHLPQQIVEALRLFARQLAI